MISFFARWAEAVSIPARDIEAITVNRWPHGYGYEYNPLFDPIGPRMNART